jgi:isocitrate dehydrogenase
VECRRNARPPCTRGSHFYLALHWARELAAEEDAITRELGEVHGRTVNIGGYYRPDIERMAEVMRPSATLNAALEEFDVEAVTSGDM